MHEQPKEKSLTLRVPPQLHTELRERAAAEERTVSQLLRAAAKVYLATDNPIPQLGQR